MAINFCLNILIPVLEAIYGEMDFAEIAQDYIERVAYHEVTHAYIASENIDLEAASDKFLYRESLIEEILANTAAKISSLDSK